MKLQIERQYVEALVAEFSSLLILKDQLRFGNKAEIAFKKLSSSELSFLKDLYINAGPEMQGQAAQLATLQKAMNEDTHRFSEDDLEQLLPACARYFIHEAIRGWLFQANVTGKPMAYLLTRLDFTPSGEEETGRITLEIKANTKGGRRPEMGEISTSFTYEAQLLQICHALKRGQCFSSAAIFR